MITNMFNQSLTALNLPPCPPPQVQKADVPNIYWTVREFLNDDVQLYDKEAGNSQPHKFIMFPALYTHFNITLCKVPAATWFKAHTLRA